MKRLTTLLISIIGIAALQAQDITGSWNGKAEIGPRSIRLVFHIEKTGGGYSATMDSPDQGAKGIPVSSATFTDGTLTISIPQLGFKYTGMLSGDRLKGSFTQSGDIFTLDMDRGDVVLSRPQEPKPPFPYRSEAAVFENKHAGIRLAGTLTMPAGGKKFPAVVLLTGSGPQNRDEELAGHKPFLVLADYLTRQGMAVLRFDDRGFGESGGIFAGSTTADFATDAAAAIDYLRTRKEIDKKKIGLLGHSEGAAVAFITAAGRRDLAFVVSMAGAAMPGDEILIRQNRDILNAEPNMPEGYVDYYIEILRRTYDTAKSNEPGFLKANADSLAGAVTRPSLYYMQTREQIRQIFSQLSEPWFISFLDYDPADDIRRVTAPVMAINGDKDLQVSSENLAIMESVLREAGIEQFCIKEYPGLNHLFQTSPTGRIQEYGQIEETISPRVLEDIAEWIFLITRQTADLQP